MSITIKEQYQGSSGDWTKDDAKEIRQFLVLSTTKIRSYDALAAVVATGVNAGTAHPSNSLIICKRISGRSISSSSDDLNWVVTAEYSKRDQYDNPLNKPADITWGGSLQGEDMFSDVNSKVVANSAGSPFEQNISRDASQFTANVTRNEAYFNPSWIYQYSNKVNSSVFSLDGVSIPTRWAKMGVISLSAWKEENDTNFRVASYPITIDPRGWQPYKALDVGTQEIVSGTRQAIFEKSGGETKKPWPLDGSGGAKTDPTADPEEISFYPYYETSFGVFNFS